MLYINKRSLQLVLIELLAKKPAASVTWLNKKVAETYKPCSVQAIYKELRKLQEGGIVVKAKDTYCLAMAWILNSIAFFDAAFDAYIDNPSLGFLLPRGQNKRTWHFSDLRRVDDFWVQVMLSLFQQSKAKYMMQWLPHPWFDLIHHEKDLSFQKALRVMGCKMYIIVGGRTFLDRYCVADWPPDLYIHSLAPSPFEDLRDKTISVIDDYVFTLKYGKETVRLIDGFYEQLKSEQDLQTAKVIDFMLSAQNVKAVLEINPRKATRLRRQIASFMGLKKSAE